MVSTTQLPDLASWLRKRKKTSGTFPNSQSAFGLVSPVRAELEAGCCTGGRILAELGLSVPRRRAHEHVGESDRGIVVAAGDSGSTALTSRVPG